MTDTLLSTRDHDLAQVAYLHFVDRLDQKEIAARLHTSRSTVSRMIRQAMDRGIVEITVKFPVRRRSELEQAVMSVLNIPDVVVVEGDASRDVSVRTTLGTVGAQRVTSLLPDSGTLGVCWGRSIGYVVDELTGPLSPPVTVVQMIGSLLDSDDASNGVELARRACSALSGNLELLSAPLIVDSVDAAQSLRQQSAVAKVLDRAAHADVALVGLGALDPDTSALVEAGYITGSDTDELRSLGAVGDVAGVFIDQDGTAVSSEFSSRVIGVALDQLRHIDHTIALAWGQHKVNIIRAAARGGYISTVLTDEATAEALLQQVSRSHSERHRP